MSGNWFGPPEFKQVRVTPFLSTEMQLYVNIHSKYSIGIGIKLVTEGENQEDNLLRCHTEIIFNYTL